MKINQVVTENLADQFAAMARARGMNVRIAGTPEQERERSRQRMAQRDAERAQADSDAAQADLAQLPELKAKYEQMKDEYDSLGGNNWQYADREQNLTDRERQARAMEHELNSLGNRIARAEKSQGAAKDDVDEGVRVANQQIPGTKNRAKTAYYPTNVKPKVPKLDTPLTDQELARLTQLDKMKKGVAEGMSGQVVFSGTGADGSTYEIIQSGPTDFMIHANGRHIDTYGSLQRAMSVLQNEVQGLQQGMAEGNYDRDDYYNAHRGSEYGRDLTATGYGGDGSKTRRDDIFKGQSKRLPADPFARTSGAVPTAGTGRIHSTAQPDEMDEGDISQLEKDVADAPVAPIANMEGAKEKIGGRHDPADFDDMVNRLKKLAGAGPMKTVYDPNTRRYKNMHTAVQPRDKK